MNDKNKKTLIKILKVVSVFLIYALIGLGFFLIYQYLGFSLDDLKQHLASIGIWAYVLFIIIQVLVNVFLFVIPGQTLQFIALGLTLFSPLVTFTVVLLGMVLGSFANFMIGRTLGHRYIEKIVGKETYVKYQAKLVTKAYIYYPIMMILPFFPDDEITLLVGLTKMNIVYFLLTTILTRAVGVAIFTFIPGQIAFTYASNLELGLLIFGIAYIGLMLLYLIRELEKLITRLIA
ncbi:MAG TPA: VTT domain-containing protein [Bacilli bacterium]|nr:VTT domain-containing protein [Bacilli bacterium]